MPRDEQIAWKFVIRLEGKKWRCPYCQKGFSGNVTRVRSHLLKQLKGGISICKNVPEPISKLMDWLIGQDRSKDDIAWKFVDTLGNNKWCCHYCREEFCGDLTGVKGHLLKIPNEGIISICAEVPDPVRTLMLSLLDDGAEEEKREANGQSSTEPQSHDMPTQAEVVADEESREANVQISTEPQTHDLPTQAEVADEGSREANSQFFTEVSPLLSPESLEYLRPLLPTPRGATHMANFTQQGVIGLNSDPLSQAERHFHQSSTLRSLEQKSHGESISCSEEEEPYVRDLPHPEETQTNDQHTPAGASSFHHDQLPAVGNSNWLQDCSQHSQLQTPMDIDPSIASQHTSDSHIIEATIVDSQVPEEATNTTGPSSSQALVPPQHQSVPHQSINLKTVHKNPTVPSSPWKNHLVTYHPQALMDIDPCIPSSSKAPNDAPLHPQIPLRGIYPISQSSLPGLGINKGAPMMSHPNTGNNFKENGALKRKLKRLYSREAGIRDDLEYAASLSLKKPNMEVRNWLVNVEKLKNDFYSIEATRDNCLPPQQQVDCLPPQQQVDILMQEAEDLMRRSKFPKGLFKSGETKVTEFQRCTTMVLEYLVGNQISRLGICGMVWIGKTTIMLQVHHRLLEKAKNVLWVTVSSDFTTQKLQDDIWRALGLSILGEKDVTKRAAMLLDSLIKSGKSIIILDNVWEPFDLEEVGIPIREGFKLVLISRSFDLCEQMDCQVMIHIKRLSMAEAHSLFLKELGSEVALNMNTIPLVNCIVRECAGLPLGVVMIARSMRGVTDEFERIDFLEKSINFVIRQRYMENELSIFPKLCYDRLGNHEVQQCFLSCALYPKDKLIDKLELIEFFIDQGLIGGLNTRKKQYDRGLIILNNLKNVCLLEDHGRTMKMRDLIRDMALHIMSVTSIVKAGKRLMMIPHEEYWTDVLEKVSLIENDIREFPLNMSPNCPKLSTLLLNNSLSYDVVIPDSFFRQLWGLKVLNLSGCLLRGLPDSISDLVNLRALLLRECLHLRRIPYLGKLRSLRKLDTSGCLCLEALEGLEMLVNLRYLDLTKTSIERLPKGTLGGLLKLQYLKVHTVYGEDVTKLRALKTLECYFEDVDDFNKCVSVIKQSNDPRYYKLKVDQEVSIFYVEVSDDARFGICGRSVYISECGHANVSVGGESGGICILIPQDVQTFRGRKCDVASNLSDMGPLENLEELHIGEWENLLVLRGGQDEVINVHKTPTPLPFPSLRVLKISRCPKLKHLFGHGSKFYLPHLRVIQISDCKEMVGITTIVTSPLPHPPPAFPSLEAISIVGCDKMKRVVESEWLPHFSNLRDITVNLCENMEEIIGDPSPYMAVEDISLESLEVQGCDNMRKLFSHELLIHLRNLQSINVDCCKGMGEMISGAGQGQEGSIMTFVNNTPSSFQSSISLPELNRLVLHDLPQLKSICEVPITCYSMEHIQVSTCPKLNKIPLQLQFGDIDDLPYIEVEDEEKWKTLIWDRSNAQAILQPYLHFHGSTCVLRRDKSQ